MIITDRYWWLLIWLLMTTDMTTDDYWWLLATTGDYWWLPMTSNDYWWPLITTDDYWWQLMTTDALLLKLLGTCGHTNRDHFLWNRDLIGTKREKIGTQIIDDYWYDYWLLLMLPMTSGDYSRLTTDDYWWQLITTGNNWWQLIWLLMTTPDDYWWLLTTTEDCCGSKPKNWPVFGWFGNPTHQYKVPLILVRDPLGLQILLCGFCP